MVTLSSTDKPVFPARGICRTATSARNPKDLEQKISRDRATTKSNHSFREFEVYLPLHSFFFPGNERHEIRPRS